MINTLLAGAFASTVISSNVSEIKTNTAKYSFSQVLSSVDYSTYTVQDGDYLSKISEGYYGSEDYWTNIWNDNPDLADPTKIETGMILKIRVQKTAIPEVLKPELQAKSVSQTVVVQPLYTYKPEAGATITVVPVAPAVQTADAPKVLTEVQINYLGNCEAGMNPARNSGNGYYGAFQFSEGTWNSMNTGYARADLAPIDVQKAAVQRLVARSSVFSQFPGCSKRMRSEGLI